MAEAKKRLRNLVGGHTWALIDGDKRVNRAPRRVKIGFSQNTADLPEGTREKISAGGGRAPGHHEGGGLTVQVRQRSSSQQGAEKNGKKLDQDTVKPTGGQVQDSGKSVGSQIDQEVYEEEQEYEQEYYDGGGDGETDQYDNEDTYYETDDQLSQEEGNRKRKSDRMIAVIQPLPPPPSQPPQPPSIQSSPLTPAVKAKQLGGKHRGQKTLNFFFTW